MVNELITEPVQAKSSVIESGLNICCTNPPINITGVNTIIEVVVPATTARIISFVPSTAASNGVLSNSSKCLVTFSITTIELSTSIPIDKIKPVIVTVFRLKPNALSRASVKTKVVGIDIETASVLLQLSKKR